MKRALPTIVCLWLAACAASPKPAPLAQDNSGTSALPLQGQSPWEALDFGFNAEPIIAPDELTLPRSERLTGLKFAGNPVLTLDTLFGPARDNYELTLKAQRTDGHDIFLGLTFPVGKTESASLILGGWGGGVCGITAVDGASANENAYKSIRDFEDNQWYAVKLRVDGAQVRAWVDGAPLFTIDRSKVKHFSVRDEVTPTAPFGLFTFGTTAKIKDIAVRKLP